MADGSAHVIEGIPSFDRGARLRAPRWIQTAAERKPLTSWTIRPRPRPDQRPVTGGSCTSGSKSARKTTPASSAPAIGANPEEPQLLHRPAADEERRSGAACGVHRRVGNRDADQVDEGEAEPDGHARESDRSPAVRGAVDDHEEHEGHHDLRNQRGGQRVLARRVVAIPVRREAGGEAEATAKTAHLAVQP
jgi:hypothetical protein